MTVSYAVIDVDGNRHPVVPSTYRFQVITLSGHTFSIHKTKPAAEAAAERIGGTVVDFTPNERTEE